jgi:hypothetical protein
MQMAFKGQFKAIEEYVGQGFSLAKKKLRSE